MKTVQISGTEHYAEDAPELLKRYESLSFADHHRSVIHLIPTTPGRVLDIGAGTRRYAAGFVALGHTVVAVEPTEELRRGAMASHPWPILNGSMTACTVAKKIAAIRVADAGARLSALATFQISFWIWHG